MSDPEVKPGTRGYVLVPAKSIDEKRLIAFGAAVWPDRSSHHRILASWWRRAQPTDAVAAIHEPTGTLAGLCAARPCEWSIEDRSHAAAAICDLYVAPGHAGKLLGRRLMRQFEGPGRFLYGFSISETAIAYVQRLGWRGPYASSLMLLPLLRAARIPVALLARRGGLELQDHEIAGGAALGALGSDLDRIETSRTGDGLARMRRGAKEWTWRLSVCGDRRYRFCIVRREGEPVGYAVVRCLMPGSSPLLGKLAAAIVVDLVAVNDEPKVLRALAARAVAIAAELRATIAFAAATAPAHCRALAASGFLSPRFPLLGRLLARRSPVFMWVPRDPAARLEADRMVLTFADSDVDLSL